MAKRNMECNLTPEEKEEVLQMFRDEYWLDHDEENELQEHMENYLFYDADQNRKARSCICTHPNCGSFRAYKFQEPEFFQKKHGDYITCPNCGQPVTLMSLGRIRNFSSINSTKETRFTVCRSAKDGGLLLASGYAWRIYDAEDLRPYLTISWREKTYLRPGKRMQWERTMYRPYGIDTGWEEKETVGEPFHVGSYASYSYRNDGDGYFIGLAEAVKHSAFLYSQLDRFMMFEYGTALDEGTPMRNVIKYLSAYTEYPNLEMAMKIEFFSAASNLVISRVKNARTLNWSAKNLQGFLKLDKQDCNAFMRADYSMELLTGYHQAKRAKKTKNMADYLDIVEAAGGAKGVDLLVEDSQKAGCSLRQAANYIRKQPQKPKDALQTWRDYLDAAEQLDMDLTQKDVAMPKNLVERHDIAISMRKFQETQAYEEKNRSMTKKLQKMYEFSMGGYRIVVPKNPEEIIREGKTLQHCVGGYAERHFKGEVTILFLRKERKPGVSFLTIEMKQRRSKRDPVVLRQIHGYRNEGYRYDYPNGQRGKRPEEKFKWFLDAWRCWLRAGSPRDKDGKPIIKEEKTA